LPVSGLRGGSSCRQSCSFFITGIFGGLLTPVVSIAVAITWLVATLAAHLVPGWDIRLAALFGGIVTVSGPGRSLRH
jgi:NhaP-type Na+/H+ or K+/H+ antiporter